MQERFSLLWLCLQKDNLYNDYLRRSKSRACWKKKGVTKLLYKDYAAFKSDLCMCQQNPEADELELWKSQKL